MKKVIVIGAGAVGLSTALQIQDAIPGCHVTIIADKIFDETTSYVAAGYYRVTTDHCPGTDPALLKQWFTDSYKHVEQLAYSEDAGASGAFPFPVYQLYRLAKEQPPIPVWAEVLRGFRVLPEDEVSDLFPGFKYGFTATTIISEGKRYLPYLMKKFRKNGGTVVLKRIDSIKQFIGKCDVLVNCSALGSKELFGDQSVYPVRGQIFKVQAPWIKMSFFTDDGTYLIPGAEAVTVGGVRQVGRSDLEVDPKDREDMWNRAVKFFPSLKILGHQTKISSTHMGKFEMLFSSDGKHAVVEKELVGLRPTRRPIRVETEEISFPEGKLQVVHNYGHGANGVGLSWGTGKHASRLVKETLENIHVEQARL